jgi:large subunit ribosomal protein L3
LSHRAPGSIGQRQTPGRVFPGKKMTGHLGHVTRSNLNLEVIQVDVERNLLLVKGSVPGPKGQDVVIRPNVRNKAPRAAQTAEAPKAAKKK